MQATSWSSKEPKGAVSEWLWSGEPTAVGRVQVAMARDSNKPARQLTQPNSARPLALPPTRSAASGEKVEHERKLLEMIEEARRDAECETQKGNDAKQETAVR